ncbi:MAG TPA: Rpn family recombination-promoting nuclease/putative transposase, partial [Allocoleopsis sp.]
VLGLKDSYLDVKAVLDDETKVFIEMQYVYLKGFEQRILYNAAKGYGNQLVKGQKYHELNPVITLTITKFQLFDAFPDVISYFDFKERYHLTDYPYGDIQMIFVELEKFNKDLEDLGDITDRWIYFMKNAKSLEMVPEKLGEITEIKQAFNIANEAGLSVDELDKIRNQERYLYDQELLREEAQEAKQKLAEAEQKAEQAEQKAEQAEQKLAEAQQRQKVVILRQLSINFGEINSEIQTKINDLSPEKLDNLFEIFLSFQNISDLIDWLQ